jgi:hypothetical protein
MIRKHSDRSRGAEARRATNTRKLERAMKHRATASDFRALERELSKGQAR